MPRSASQPYKGSRIVPVRLDPELHAALVAEIEATNPRRRDEPFTVSSWIVRAIREKLAHAKRSRRRISLDAAPDSRSTCPDSQ